MLICDPKSRQLLNLSPMSTMVSIREIFEPNIARRQRRPEHRHDSPRKSRLL